MNRGLLYALIAGASFLNVNLAQAQHHREWISSTGNDSNTCALADPCATFNGALAKAPAGGEITCLNPGTYGPLTITKSITINCDVRNTLTLGGNLSNVQITTAVSDTVVITGMDFDFVRSSASTFTVLFDGAGTLVLDKVTINKALTSGITFTPNGAGRLVIRDSLVAGNGTSPLGAGILVKPQAGGTAQVMLERVNVSSNVFGIAADGTGSTGGINMTIVDSASSANSQDGIIAVTPSGGSAPIGVYVKNAKSVNNNIGIRSIGPNVTVRVDGSSVIGNGTGLSFSGGGALLTAGNNMVRANGSDGAFSGSVGLQ
jgi:hypothetical protein